MMKSINTHTNYVYSLFAKFPNWVFVGSYQDVSNTPEYKGWIKYYKGTPYFENNWPIDYPDHDALGRNRTVVSALLRKRFMDLMFGEDREIRDYDLLHIVYPNMKTRYENGKQQIKTY